MNINIGLQIPIINGYVVVPGYEQTYRNILTPDDVLTAIPGSTIVDFTRERSGMRQYIQLPEYDSNDNTRTDYHGIIIALAASMV